MHSSYTSITAIIRRCVTSCALREAEFDNKTLEVDGEYVVYMELIPRKSREGDWVGINISTITVQGTSATVKSLFFPGRKSWERCSDMEVETLINNTVAFIEDYASRCAE